MATQELIVGTVDELDITWIGEPGHGVTTFVEPIEGSIIFDLTDVQRRLLFAILGLRYLAPAPVKPAFRGRRHAW